MLILKLRGEGFEVTEVALRIQVSESWVVVVELAHSSCEHTAGISACLRRPQGFPTICRTAVTPRPNRLHLSSHRSNVEACIGNV